MSTVLCRKLQTVFEIQVRMDNREAEKSLRSVRFVLSHHLKSCQYLQQSIDRPSLLAGPKLYSVLIDYADSLCRVT